MRCIAGKLHKRLCYERQIVDNDHSASDDGDNQMHISVFPDIDKYSNLQI